MGDRLCVHDDRPARLPERIGTLHRLHDLLRRTGVRGGDEVIRALTQRGCAVFR